MTCSTSNCFYDQHMDPWNVCVSLYKECSQTLAAVRHRYVRTVPGHRLLSRLKMKYFKDGSVSNFS